MVVVSQAIVAATGCGFVVVVVVVAKTEEEIVVGRGAARSGARPDGRVGRSRAGGLRYCGSLLVARHAYAAVFPSASAVGLFSSPSPLVPSFPPPSRASSCTSSGRSAPSDCGT